MMRRDTTLAGFAEVSVGSAILDASGVAGRWFHLYLTLDAPRAPGLWRQRLRRSAVSYGKVPARVFNNVIRGSGRSLILGQ